MYLQWYPEVKEQCPGVPVMLVGCKSDMRNEIKALPPDKPKPAFVTYDQVRVNFIVFLSFC